MAYTSLAQVKKLALEDSIFFNDLLAAAESSADPQAARDAVNDVVIEWRDNPLKEENADWVVGTLKADPTPNNTWPEVATLLRKSPNLW
jgi:hypothetical protein